MSAKDEYERLLPYVYWADFQNFDSQDRIRLNVNGFSGDVERLGTNLAEGLILLVADCSNSALVRLQWVEDDGIWAGVLLNPTVAEVFERGKTLLNRQES